ncbi:hypothetical protein RND81_10G195500 [Saponaria officinalis]|uniref:non-specific serine/threonine protein kinase n=1 Tax=Saponaria officinalis TaxID=3572 RepID=A0AAW1I4I0_SAPOF
MHQKNQQYLLRFISVIFLIFADFISSSLSAYVDEQYASCAPLSTTCGPSLEIEYPFWDINRPDYCGHPGFELECQGNSLTLHMQDQIYNVLDINNKSNTLTISKPQFSQGPCPTTKSELTNTTLDFSLFAFTSTSENATLFYDCQRKPDLIAPFSFTCPQSSYDPESSSTFTSPLNFIAIDEKWKVELRKICTIEIDIPVFKTQVSDLVNGHTNINDVVSKGFELKWTIDESQCKSCIGSEGRCGFNHTLSRPICLCDRGVYNTTCAQSNALAGVPMISPGTDEKNPNTNTNTNTKTNTIGVVVGAVTGAILLSLLIFFCQRKYKKIQSTGPLGPPTILTRAFSTTLDPNASSYFGVELLSYSVLEEATDSFNPAKELGAGGFGMVYHGILKDGREVAVKRLYENNNKRAEQFLNEVEILANLRHKNLVNLYGCTSRQSRELLLVYEYVPNGTVADHLHGKNAKLGLLRWPIRLRIATETASALVYLHDSDIIHRDVKTQNILLDKDFSVKVADFGLSRLFPLDVTHISTAPQGTPGYLDPEYHQCYQLTEKSDVYSFGVLLAELISSKPAVDITRRRADINLCNMLISKIQNNTLDEFIDNFLEFQFDLKVKKEIKAVAGLAFQCLQSTRELRPTMKEVLERLCNIKDHEDKIDSPEEVDIPKDYVFMLKDDFSPDSSSIDESSVRTLVPHAGV